MCAKAERHPLNRTAAHLCSVGECSAGSLRPLHRGWARHVAERKHALVVHLRIN